MPANDMDVFCTPSSNKAHGVVIQFPDGMSEDQCNDILRRMFKAGFCKADYTGQAPTCHSFNPNHGSPCWYIP